MSTASWTAATCPPASGKGYVEQLQAKLDELGTGRIATVMGRYYAMDRDKRWDRVQRAYDAIALGEGSLRNPAAAVQKSYDSGVTDEFMEPGGLRQRRAQVRDNDSIIFYQLPPRPGAGDHPLLCGPRLQDVERKKGYFPVIYVCTTEYDATMPNVTVAYPARSWSTPSESILASWA